METRTKYGFGSFKNLDQGEYEITEIKTKPGMGLMKEKIKVTLLFTMTFNETLRHKNVKFSIATEDINYTGKWYFHECTYEITNNQLFGMPMTGDDGKWRYGFFGFLELSIISYGFVFRNKSKKKKNTDKTDRTQEEEDGSKSSSSSRVLKI